LRAELPLEPDVRAFADAVVERAGGPARSVEASARSADGGIEVWFCLQAPPEADLHEHWTQQLGRHGLNAERVRFRN
jgi:hypothetical protein